MLQNNKLAEAVCETAEVVCRLLERQSCVLIAIDGRCAAGKTTFAATLSKALSCEVVHMDDFFLRPEQRSDERLKVPGENVDHERFLEEVLNPYAVGKDVIYRPYDCHSQSLKEAVQLKQDRVLITEGAYSCHETLFPWYDLCVFLDVSPKLQMERINARNGAQEAKRFKELWIPMEEAYFKAFSIKEKCDLYYRI